MEAGLDRYFLVCVAYFRNYHMLLFVSTCVLLVVTTMFFFIIVSGPSSRGWCSFCVMQILCFKTYTFCYNIIIYCLLPVAHWNKIVGRRQAAGSSGVQLTNSHPAGMQVNELKYRYLKRTLVNCLEEFLVPFKLSWVVKLRRQRRHWYIRYHRHIIIVDIRIGIGHAFNSVGCLQCSETSILQGVCEASWTPFCEVKMRSHMQLQNLSHGHDAMLNSKTTNMMATLWNIQTPGYEYWRKSK